MELKWPTGIGWIAAVLVLLAWSFVLLGAPLDTKVLTAWSFILLSLARLV